MRDLLSAAILGLVEGVTEFIPVSSTGHLIIVGDLLGFEGPRAMTFEIVIQLGAIVAVAIGYRERLRALLSPRARTGFAGPKGSSLVALTTAPAMLVGAATHGLIREHLFSTTTVALGLGLGGVDRRTAAEYSFLAAIPVIGAAALFDLSRRWHLLSPSDAPLFLLGFGVAFASAWLALRVFLSLLGRISLASFGWYRIGAAMVLLVLVSTR
jgi:undecaprenyl-diphosphatase